MKRAIAFLTAVALLGIVVAGAVADDWVKVKREYHTPYGKVKVKEYIRPYGYSPYYSPYYAPYYTYPSNYGYYRAPHYYGAYAAAPWYGYPYSVEIDD